MFRRAVDGGVNHVDTAWMQHGEPGDFDCLPATQLERLQLDAVDYHLLHSLDECHRRVVTEQDQLAAAERALADGRIGHLGCSFHGTAELSPRILEATDLWELCQTRLNDMDEELQAGRRGLKLAAARGLGVIFMEPVRGGMLAQHVPPRVQALWDSAPVRRAPAEWALRWVWSLPCAQGIAIAGWMKAAQAFFAG